MAGDADTIKSFLVGLGFGVDDASLAKFNKAIASATLKVTALYASTRVAAAGIVAGISEVSKGFEQMGYEYHIIAPAINKALLLRQELLKSYRLAGINIRKVVQDSIKLNLSLTKTKFAFEAIYKSVASRFFERITKGSDLFRQRIYENMPRIQRALETFVNFVFTALDATSILGARVWSILGRIYDFFLDLDRATSGWSTKILAVVAAWEFLNLSFLATPLGAVITGLVAILALFDDFKTWQEGGQSLFDWSSFVPVIESFKKVLQSVYDVLNAIGEVIASVIVAAIQVFSGDLGGALRSLKDLGGEVINVFSKAWGRLKSIYDLAVAVGGFVSGVFGGWNAQTNLQNSQSGVPISAPLGVGTSNNSQTNQNVTQQTNVSIQGVPDAQGVGSAVSGVMSKQNYDLVRDLIGSIRPGGQLQSTGPK